MKSKPDNNTADQEYAYSYESDMTLKHHASRTAEKQARWFLPYLQPGMTLLDCGCGSGSINVGLATAVAPGRVTGIDISDIEIERAQKRAAEANISTIRFKVGNVYELDFPSDSFDALFSHNVLEHVPEPDRALNEMHRVLKPGGIIGIRDIDFGGYLFSPDNELMEKLENIWAAVIESTGGNPRLGHHLGTLLHEVGFVEVKMSASYDVWSELESRRSWTQIVVSRLNEADFVKRVTGKGLAKAEELEAIKHFLQKWQVLPDAFRADSHGEATGRKA